MLYHDTPSYRSSDRPDISLILFLVYFFLSRVVTKHFQFNNSTKKNRQIFQSLTFWRLAVALAIDRRENLIPCCYTICLTPEDQSSCYDSLIRFNYVCVLPFRLCHSRARQ